MHFSPLIQGGVWGKSHYISVNILCCAFANGGKKKRIKTKQTNKQTEKQKSPRYFLCYFFHSERVMLAEIKQAKRVNLSALKSWPYFRFCRFEWHCKHTKLCKEKKKSSTNMGHVWCQIQRKIIKESSGSKRSAIFLIMRSLAETSHNLNSSGGLTHGNATCQTGKLFGVYVV